MKKTDEIRIEANKLEKEISKLVESFYSNVGNCDLSINIESVFQHGATGQVRLIETGIKVNVRV